jgi:hypothetical protein
MKRREGFYYEGDTEGLFHSRHVKYGDLFTPSAP